ncbi:hypothetical protein niasHT_038417 [Heterodera trifolii]|uniref:Uncharacterized protein n=1 Tax=Heterodera trifolii TaxID=157864 RepID=A0ABD2IQQ2_9BILA
MSVIVTVQKNYTGDNCQAAMAQWDAGEGKDAEKECLWRKCTQQVQYKVDLGYSKVRMNDRMPFQYPRGLNREMFVREKNRQSRMLAERVRRLNNDAFQPYLYYEFEKLIRHFYDGHSRILALFNLPIILKFKNDLIELVNRNWQFDWGRHNEDVTDITFFEAIKYRIPPSPIPMIEAYQKETRSKRKLVEHTNQLFRLLLELWRDLSQNVAARENAKCQKVIAEIEQIIKNEPLVARVAYNPVRSMLVRNLEVILQSKISFALFTNVHLILSVDLIQMFDLGSTMGLYFGLTLLTVFELIIFFLFHKKSTATSSGSCSQPRQNARTVPAVYSIPRPKTVANAPLSVAKDRRQPIIIKRGKTVRSH